MTDFELGRLEGMFQEQKKHFDYRFDEIKEINKEQDKRTEKLDKRIEKLEKRKLFDRLTLGLCGVVGGYLAGLGVWPFKN